MAGKFEFVILKIFNRTRAHARAVGYHDIQAGYTVILVKKCFFISHSSFLIMPVVFFNTNLECLYFCCYNIPILARNIIYLSIFLNKIM